MYDRNMTNLFVQIMNEDLDLTNNISNHILISNLEQMFAYIRDDSTNEFSFLTSKKYIKKIRKLMGDMWYDNCMLLRLKYALYSDKFKTAPLYFSIEQQVEANHVLMYLE